MSRWNVTMHWTAAVHSYAGPNAIGPPPVMANVRQMSTHRVGQGFGRRRGGGISVLPIIGLSLLLVVPVYALSRFAASVDWRVLAGAALALSLVTFFAHRSDK